MSQHRYSVIWRWLLLEIVFIVVFMGTSDGVVAVISHNIEDENGKYTKIICKKHKYIFLHFLFSI